MPVIKIPPRRSSTTDIPSFATTQLSLLAAELAVETNSTAALLSTHAPTTVARAGLAILNLTIANRRTGMGGKTVLELEPDPALDGSHHRGSSSNNHNSSSSNPSSSEGGAKGSNRWTDGATPSHDIGTGDIVRVGPQPKGNEKKRDVKALEDRSVSGVVVRAARGGIHVALDKDEDEGVVDGRIWVMNWTMDRMQKMSSSDHTNLMRIMFGHASPTPVPANLEDPETGAGPVTFKDPTLNDSQKDAVRFALASREVALIHGPPGTGKTYTLVELIRQLVDRGARILVCGPSNVSVDNIVERLAPFKIPLVRLGHPARLLPSVLSHSLDVLTQTSDAAEIVRDIRKELDSKQASIKKTKNGRERRAIYLEMRDLRKEFRERERKCVDTLVQGSKVVFATLHGAGGSQARHERFDVVIIDEASQALEAQSWIPLLTASKVVLAGDHLQLPPTVKSRYEKTSQKTSIDAKENKTQKDGEKSADAYGEIITGMTLSITMFGRLLNLLGPSVKRMLTTQYRMHDKIMQFPSQAVYDNRLIAAESVRSRLLYQLDYPVTENDDTREPLVFYDTQGGAFPELAEDPEDTNTTASSTSTSTPKVSKSAILSDSRSNPLEASLAASHVRRLIAAGLRPTDIAVITPYNAQLAALSALLPRDQDPTLLGLELGSVDGFQGREKEAVVLTLVRSNEKADVGFLAEKRRLNVAMTRPRRHLCVIGDSETISRGGGPFLKKWMEWLEENADLRYPDPAELG